MAEKKKRKRLVPGRAGKGVVYISRPTKPLRIPLIYHPKILKLVKLMDGHELDKIKIEITIED